MLPQIYDEIIKMVSNLLVIGLVDDGRRAAIYVDDIGASNIVEAIKVFGRRC
ncbi:hypothetical protein MNBD_GAMMA09-3160 [hydrothermal vent metagenome]|uniref:Uncharacterized protein n=1 Tax=hydrothermal vent metagenome TaxID=652676 RepID=A0A3B0YJM7_9ZZZZ